MLAALLVAFIVVRVTVIEAFAGREPSKAAAIWPGHPKVVLESGLAEVGATAAAGRAVDLALTGRLISASKRAPLAQEPFLVRGVEAQMSGDEETALRAFLAARQRNPRAVAARYFLADLYLRTGQARAGLAEISSLARLVPESLPKVAPYLAAFAKTPRAASQVKAMVETQPQLEMALLNELAGDARNAELIGYLWSGRGGEEARPWQARLLNALVEAARFDQARTAWGRFTGIAAPRDQLFDSDFGAQAMAPFGWQLASGPAGVAEPQDGGRLHVLFYGREDAVLASQLLTLPAGRYRLSMTVGGGSPAKALAWTVRCLPASNVIATSQLARAGAMVVPLAVPGSGCEAQRLELAGTAPEFPQQAEVRISELRLEPETGR